MKFLSNILVKAGLVVEGSTQLNSLAGVGTRMVVTNAAGVVSTQAIPVSSVTSVFGRTGAVVAQAGDYTTAQVTESGNLYYTDARARAAISSTATGLTYSAGVISLTAGYSIPTTASQANWDAAYAARITTANAPLSIAGNAISISQANATTNGFLSSTDWNTFNNKISGSSVAGRVAFYSGTNAITGSTELVFDSLNNRLGVSTAVPLAKVHITAEGTTGSTQPLLIQDNANVNLFYINDIGNIFVGSDGQSKQAKFFIHGIATSPFIDARSTGVTISSASNNDLVLNGNPIKFSSGATEIGRWYSTGNLRIQTGGTFTDDLFKVDVQGTVRVTGNLTTNVTSALLKTNASGVLTAAIAGTDYQTPITNPVTGTAAAGQVPYFTSASEVAGSNNLFWDNANTALAIGGTTIDANIALQVNSSKGIRINGTGGGFGYSIVRGVETTFITNNGSGSVISSTNTIAFNTGGSEAFRVASNRNISIGTISDLGVRLGVVGDTLLRGSGNTLATTALTVQDSGSANMLRLLNDTTLKLGSQNVDIFPTANGSTVSNAGRGLIISTGAGSQGTGAVKIVGTSLDAAGNNWSLWLSHTFGASSGTATHSGILLNQTINQTGGANGITRGLYVNPTLTAAADWRSIEWSNNSGWGLYGAGTANNYLAGTLSVGTTATVAGYNIVTGVGVFVGSNLQIQGSLRDNRSNGIVVQSADTLPSNRILTIGNATYSSINFSTTAGGSVSVPNLYVGAQSSIVSDIVVAGSSTSTNGSVILRGYYTAGHLTILGTDASSGGPMLSYGIQSAQNSTAGAFVSSSGITIPRSAYVQNGGHIWYTAPSSSTAIGTAVVPTKHMELYNSGNLVLGGGADDATNRLQVGGNAFIKGTGNTSGTIALQVQNSDGTNLIRAGNNNAVTVTNLVVNNLGSTTLAMPGNNYFYHDAVGSQGRLVFYAQNYLKIGFGGNGNGITINPSSAAVNELSGEINVAQRTLRNVAIYAASVASAISGGSTAGTFTANGTVGFDPTNNHAGGHLIGVYIAETFNPNTTLKDVNYSAARLSPIINQTGGAVSATRGILVSPTLTAAADWRSIEWSNNAGWGLYGVGTAKNYLNGTTLIGTTTDDGINKLQVAGSIASAGIMRSDAARTAATNDVSIALLGSNITTYAAGFSMSAGGFGLNAVYAQHEQRFGGNATFDAGNLNGGGLILNRLAPTAAGTITMNQQAGRIRTMSNLHLQTQIQGNNNITVTHMSGLHIYGHYRTTGTITLTVGDYYGVLLADPNEFSTGPTITGSNWGFYQQGAAPTNYFGGKVNIGTTAIGTSPLRVAGLPTSAAGLGAGEVWNNGGVLTIV